MVVVGDFVADQMQLRNGLVVAPAVDGDRRGEQPLLDGAWLRSLPRRLAPTDVQVQPDTLVQLFFFGILTQHRLETLAGVLVVVSLKRREAALVQPYGFHIR